MPIIVVDLDGTLCNSDHRNHLAQAGEWEEFHKLSIDDKPHFDVHNFACNINHEIFDLVLCTGRNESARGITQRWLAQYGLLHKTEALIMRPDFDYTPDHELKPRILEDWYFREYQRIEDEDREWKVAHDLLLPPQEAVSFILDDRDKVVEAWRKHGYNCWQVRQGSY